MEIKHSTTHLVSQQVIIPTDAEDLMTVAEKILTCHQKLGTESPLKVQMIADLNYKHAQAKSKHEEGSKYRKLMEEAFCERDLLLGLKPIHKSTTSSTASITNIISFLAEILESTEGEKKMSQWGFQHQKVMK
jgi:hypothetical protein